MANDSACIQGRELITSVASSEGSSSEAEVPWRSDPPELKK